MTACFVSFIEMAEIAFLGPAAVAPRAAADPTPLAAATRRQQLLAGAALLGGLPFLRSGPAQAADAAPPAAPASDMFVDPTDGFSLAVPRGWAQGGGALDGSNGAPPSRFSNASGLQRVVAWVAPDAADVSIAVTVKTPGADYTGLGSFGSAQDFGGARRCGWRAAAAHPHTAAAERRGIGGPSASRARPVFCSL
jgi:hypothetical protein